MTRRLHVFLAVALLAAFAGSCVPPGGNQAPKAVASATPSVGPAPLTVHFSAAGSSDPDGSIASFFWQFGDGGTSNLANPTHTFNGVSVYAATLTVTDNLGATGTKTITVEATAPNQSPVAQASATPTSGNAPLTVAFSSTGSNDPDGSIASYSWDFGDSVGTSTLPAPSYTYTTPGAYVALLTVTDDDGATTTASVAITVGTPPANVPPTAVLNASPLTGKAPVTVDVDTSASLDPDGTIVGWSLNDGNGHTTTSTTPIATSLTYTVPGTYTITLTVTDDDAATDTDTATVVVVANVPPTASAHATPTSGMAPLAVAFTSTGSGDSDGTIASYSWAFGDGGTGSGPSPSHTYAIGGVFTATLTVTDDSGDTDTDTVTITAIGTTITPSSGPAPSSITVTVPCEPVSGHPDVATAIVALESSPGGTVVSTASFDNSASGQPTATFTLAVPSGTPAGSYHVTSSCDTYMDSVQYAPVPFTVT